MEFKVIGSLLVQENGESAIPSAPKPRQIVALLLLNANRVVSVQSLTRELWSDNPPQSVATTLQTYILQIRKTLASALGTSSSRVARDVLITKPGGYQWHVPPGALDLHRYESLLAEGRTTLAAGDNEGAATLLREALDLWRDAPLVDIKPGRLLEVQIMRLQESRLSALEQRIEADVRMGRHHEILPELIELTAEHHLHENLHAQLMLALYRAGRRSSALASYRRLRTALAEELGLEPSIKLERLHQAILCCDRTLDVTTHGGALTMLDRLIADRCA
ncbi:DNA-binding SARP family transcriptional activator [Micromonospora profundi]|uniref:AfsR/SARP family transcriptional regulator n=1 Tax=Micromonospora profundi TaxID=1420889 RepID=UPI001438B503|nr:AfsR/SARP family transcriptional regulator [Micromonospora profundi]NJC11493.1 DNA-binding SARP family transcriptional activator [Micromonospora profundi]